MESQTQIDILLQYGIKKEVLDSLHQMDIDYLRDIQLRAVEKGLFNFVSFLISSPSGSGKTLIGELAAINTIFNLHKKSLYLVPLRALANEKYLYFNSTYKELSLHTLYCVGDQDISPKMLERSDLIIMTYEKFDSYLRINRESKWISEIATIIIDEIHIISDAKRGARLESLIVQIFQHLKSPQIIALSATIGNPEKIADWLRFLEEKYCKKGFECLIEEKRPIELQYSFIMTVSKNEEILKITNQIIAQDGQILVFSNSRRDCELMAFELKASLVPKVIDINYLIRYHALKYSFDPSYISQTIQELIPYSVCFHHAGLNNAEKILIESLYQKKIIRLLMTTSTLSAGINTPARAIIIKDYQHYVFSDHSEGIEPQVISKGKKIPIERNLFHQICGRAGRPGFDESGLIFILINDISERVWIEENYFKSNSNGKLIPFYDKLGSQIISNLDNFSEIVLNQIMQTQNCTKYDLLLFFMDTFQYFLIQEKGGFLNLSLKMFPIDLSELILHLLKPDTIKFLSNFRIIIDLIEFNPNHELKLKIKYVPYDMNEILTLSAKLTENYKKSKFLEELLTNNFVERDFWFDIKGGVKCSCMIGSAFTDFHIFMEKKIEMNTEGYCFDKFAALFALKSFELRVSGLDLPGLEINFGFLEETVEYQTELFFMFISQCIWPKNIVTVLEKQDFITIKPEIPFSIYVPENLCDMALRNYISPNLAKYLFDSLKKIPPDCYNSLESFYPLLQNCMNMLNGRSNNSLNSILDYWVNEIPVKELIHQVQNFNDNELVYEGDILSIIDQIGRIFKFIMDYFSKYEEQAIFLRIKAFYQRIKNGVKLDLVPWVEKYKDIQPHHFRKLVEAGFRTPDSLLVTSPKELSVKSDLPLEICTLFYQ